VVWGTIPRSEGEAAEAPQLHMAEAKYKAIWPTQRQLTEAEWVALEGRHPWS
jgi:hypothetical protein